MNTAQRPPIPIHLVRGQAHWLQAQAGMRFVGVAGCFVVTQAPRWLGGCAWQANAAVHPGQSHRVDEGGWLQLGADAPAELLCVPAPSTGSRARLAGTLRSVARLAFA